MSYSFFFNAHLTIIIIIIRRRRRRRRRRKQGKSPFASDESHYFARITSGILQLLEPRSSQSLLSWAPFLKIGPPKITERGPLGPQRPISRINPVTETCNV